MRIRVRFRNPQSEVEDVDSYERIEQQAREEVINDPEYIDGISNTKLLVEEKMNEILENTQEWIYGYLLYIGQENYKDPDTELPMLQIVGVVELEEDGQFINIPTTQLQSVKNEKG